ncbi:MAG: DDE-type integrase/transposase/recombinase [Thermomicrobiales bacterium]|nr:DDE-type integrase/transposase/recombinase [Thermomicrobiales bacterium]
MFFIDRARPLTAGSAYRTHGIQGLIPKSRRPKRTRKQQWSADGSGGSAVASGASWCRKEKIAVLLAEEEIITSASTVGRVLASLKRRTLLVEPRSRTRTRKPVVRPYATRVPKEKRGPETPGALLQIDTVHIRPPGPERRQFTAIDVVSRYAVLSVRSRATALTAAAFLDDVQARMPRFRCRLVQVDGGSEFMAEFEQVCQQRDCAVCVATTVTQAQWSSGTVEWDVSTGVLGMA